VLVFNTLVTALLNFYLDPTMSTYEGIVDPNGWDEGDFTLISADGVPFRVHSHHLASARYAPSADVQLT
jgi:hypothetical protein